MKQKHFNIPIFIPELACPFQCLYCDQVKISGAAKVPDDLSIIQQIEDYLATISGKGSDIQLAYFGGSFTGLPLESQIRYLELVEPYIRQKRISGVRISTRPDYISREILDLLKKSHVETIELGAQSMDNEVLKASKRGHTAEDTFRASRMIKEYGFALGLQMMPGLPHDTLEKSVYTARKIIELEANITRIYPTLVIKGTALEKMFEEGHYKPLDLEEAVHWCTRLLEVFEQAGIPVIKLGLHPSDALVSGNEMVAGPFHPSLRELVLSAMWMKKLSAIKGDTDKSAEISVAEGQVNYAVGYGGSNKKWLEKKFRTVKFNTSPTLTDREFRVFFTS